MKKLEKTKKFGEVFTPPYFVNEMLDVLPVEVWKDPNLKWLDNSCGDGNFLFEVKKRLLQFHSEDHIVSNMIYGVEIQKDNAEKAEERLGTKNIKCADSLSFNYWGLKFDIIVGNPPYNKDKGDKKGNTCNPLWGDFVEKSIETLKDNGYLLYVHPPLWRKPEHKIGKLFRNYSIRFIKILGLKDSQKVFNCGTKVDYYLLKKSKENTKTIIVDEKGKQVEIDVQDMPFIPNYSIRKAKKYFSGKNTFDVLYNCLYHHYTNKKLSDKETETHNKKCIYLVNKKGVTYYYSDEDNGHFGVKKIIIPMGCYKPILDLEGEFGMCEVAFGIIVENKEIGEKLFGILNSEEFKEVIESCKWKLFQLDWRLFKYLSKDIIE